MNGECVGPLSDICVGASCPTYAKILRDGWGSSEGGTIQTCKEGHIVSGSGGFSGSSHYFDASGRLVGVTEWADHGAYCEQRSLHVAYGRTKFTGCRTTASRGPMDPM